MARHGIVKRCDISWKSPRFLGLFTQSYYMPTKAVLFFIFMCVRDLKKGFHSEKSLGMGSWHEKRRRVLSLRVCVKSIFSEFVPQGLGREKNKKENSFFSIFLLPLCLLQKSIFNFQKDSEDLKKESRSVKKKIFA